MVLSVCSWEPSDNVQQCNRLLASFWKHVGMDDKDYPIGYEVVAEESWISPCSITLFLADPQPSQIRRSDISRRHSSSPQNESQTRRQKWLDRLGSCRHETHWLNEFLGEAKVEVEHIRKYGG